VVAGVPISPAATRRLSCSAASRRSFVSVLPPAPNSRSKVNSRSFPMRGLRKVPLAFLRELFPQLPQAADQ